MLVEAHELRILGLLLEIVFAGIHVAVEIVEQFGDRLDPLVMLVRRRIERLAPSARLPALTAVTIFCVWETSASTSLVDVDLVVRHRLD